MQPSQIAYYNALTPESKTILQTAALKCSFIIDYELQNRINKFLNNNITQKKVTEVINDSVKQNFFSVEKGWKIIYTASVDFLVFVFPKIRFLPSLWDNSDISSGFFKPEKSPLLIFRNCLYALLYQPKRYEENENRFIMYAPNCLTEYYKILINDENYKDYIKLISKDIIYLVTMDVIKNGLYILTPLSVIYSQIEKIQLLSDYPELIEKCGFITNTQFFMGQHDEVVSNPKHSIQFDAIKFLINGRLEDSIAAFNKYLKELSASGNKAPLPSNSNVAYFYIVALLLSGSSVYVPVFQKVLFAFLKKNDCGFNNLYAAIAYDAMNEPKNDFKDLINDIKLNILNHNSNFNSLTGILIYYLINEKPDENLSFHVYNIIKKTVEGAYYLLGIEAAYVAKSWYNEKRFHDLYNDLTHKLNYQPVISRIQRKEEWEKSLNLLLGIKTKSAAKNKDNAENNARVVYFFNPKNKNIQPVLQTRTAKGWSKGRNIAMKTFQNLDVKGVTEQDIRISKHIKYYDNYYNSYYDFDKNIFLDMVGHPYIFLENSNEMPVEFVAAQAIVSINKVSKGYQLVTSLKKADEPVFIEKETNTRYKVYNLSYNQIRIIKIINEKELIVPESGKAKLTELLGSLSAEGLAVHSDFAASDKYTHIEMKELPADSRIRVQLLPFGDGLKTELFSKPFGERPPYCKPGKGGKMLISNEKDVQLQVKRNLKLEAENEQTLLNDIQSLESLNVNDDLMSFDDPLDSLSLLDILANRQDICVVEWPEGEKYKLRGKATISNLNIKITSGINWFDLQGELQVDENTVITLQQLLRLTKKSHNNFIELSTGEFIALSERLKKQLDNLRLFSNEDKKGVQLNKFASVGLSDFFEEMENMKADKTWKSFRQQIEKTKEENASVPASLNGELRAYQEDGFRWLARLAEWNAGACLADDMGLGKTVQALAMLLYRASLGAALVVCPVSVVSNWVSEAGIFAPSLRFKTLGVNASNRPEILQSLEAGDVLVTSYGLLQSEDKMFAEHDFATIVLDEAHVIKNYATKTSKATMQLKAGFRMALTGTPLQNHLGEIWNLFNFINPGLLGSLQYFTDTFVKAGDSQSKKHLKKMIAPFILRRTKTAVLDELPPKTEIVKKIQLSAEETAFYEALRRQALENLSQVDESKHLQVLAEITKLRQASCNPLLIDPNIQIPSSKLAAFLDIVGELIENNHRALVFSQFVTHLTIVRRALDKQGITYQYLDGSSSQVERQRSVANFQNGKGELFLISLKAGGLGLNLTAADFVIHLDPWWNPAVEDQASDRSHRIGQQRPVTVYRLVAENTIEEKIIQLHHRKRDLAEQLLEGSDMAARLSVREIVELIREGAGSL